MKDNKIFKEYMQNTYNKEENYNSILSKVKGGVNMKKKILNIAAVLIVIIGLGVFTPKIYARIVWNIDYKKYQERQISRKQIAIDESKTNGFSENINMDYLYKDGIGVKINSLMLTTDYLGLEVDIKLKENIKDEKTSENYTSLTYGFAIYDENNNIYDVCEPAPNKNLIYWKKLYKELNINSDIYNNLNDSSSHGIKEINKNIALANIELNSTDGFPKAKKLYVRIFQLGYLTYNRTTLPQFTQISDNEWQFEIDIPEKFYNTTATELKLANKVKGVTLNKATITETGLTMKIKINGLSDLISQIRTEPKAGELLEDIAYITDEDDKVYIALNIGGGDENEQELRFGIGKNLLNKRIYLHINVNDIHEVVELVQ